MTISREWRAAAAGGGLFVLGVVMLRLGFAAFDQRAGWLAVLACWIVGASGLLAWLRVPSSRVGLLLVAAAAAWAVAAIVPPMLPREPPAGRALEAAVAAVLVQAIVSFPSGRVRGRATTCAVLLAWLGVLIPPPAGPIVMVAGMLGGLAATWRSGSRPSVAVVGAGLALVATVTLSLPAAFDVIAGPGADGRIVRDVALAAIGILLGGALVRDASQRRRIADLVIELRSGGRAGLAGQLAAAVGDPTLRVGYPRADGDGYVDAGGLAVGPAEDDSRMTMLTLDGETVALVTHAPGRLVDAAVRQAMARGAALLAANIRLQAGVMAQVREVEASRRRLIDVADAESERLRLEIRERLEPRLAELESVLAETGALTAHVHLESGAGAVPRQAGEGRPLAQVRAARRDIAMFAAGLAPAVLEGGGLRTALLDLASRAPIPATVQATCDGPDDMAGRIALYFTCSEGLTNIARHAAASRIGIRLDAADGNVILEIVDDGTGGADRHGGSGLQGLRDRLDAVGGTLVIESPPGRGTRLVATVPRARTPAAALPPAGQPSSRVTR